MERHIKALLAAFLILSPVLIHGRIFARWHTSMGSFTAELYDELVPITANNFRDLANDGFYNNLIFHRVIETFMIQDGCPQGTGFGGPGYTIQDEFRPDLLHDSAGMLAMARTSAPNSAGSQYYITLAPAPHLDGGYAVFGRITEGLDNVMAIGSVATNANDRPLIPVNIHQLRMLDLTIGSLYPDPSEPVAMLPGNSQMFITEATTLVADLSYEWYLNDELLPENTFMTELSFPPNHPDELNILRCNIVSSDSISYEVTWNIMVSTSQDDAHSPELNPISITTGPNPFSDVLTLYLESNAKQTTSVDIFNVKGQKVRELQTPAMNQGSWTLFWDGKDASGKELSAGMYLARLKSAQKSVYRKIIKK